MKPSPIPVLLLAITLSGCTFFLPADQLRPKAAYELQCPADKLQLTELGGDCGKKLGNQYSCTYGVEGCGRRATYNHVPKTDTWVTDTTTMAPASVPAPEAAPSGGAAQ